MAIELVATRTGSVNRNAKQFVAARMGGVNRNITLPKDDPRTDVAARTGGVNRNIVITDNPCNRRYPHGWRE